jgi:hypothetical protein
MITKMAEHNKSMSGNKYPVTAYVDTETFLKIEEMRGDVPRSAFLGKLITKIVTG